MTALKFNELITTVLVAKRDYVGHNGSRVFNLYPIVIETRPIDS
jgi:hypothetical protein